MQLEWTSPWAGFRREVSPSLGSLLCVISPIIILLFPGSFSAFKLRRHYQLLVIFQGTFVPLTAKSFMSGPGGLGLWPSQH